MVWYITPHGRVLSCGAGGFLISTITCGTRGIYICTYRDQGGMYVLTDARGILYVLMETRGLRFQHGVRTLYLNTRILCVERNRTLRNHLCGYLASGTIIVTTK